MKTVYITHSDVDNTTPLLEVFSDLETALKWIEKEKVEFYDSYAPKIAVEFLTQMFDPEENEGVMRYVVMKVADGPEAGYQEVLTLFRRSVPD